MIVDFFIPTKLKNDSRNLAKAKTMIYILSFISLTTILLDVFNRLSQSDSVFPFLAIGCFSLCLIGLLKISGSPKLVGHAMVGALAVVFFSMTLETGGITSIDCISIFLVSLVAYIAVGFKDGIPWMGAFIIWVFYLYGLAGDPEQMLLFKNQSLSYSRDYYLAVALINLLFPFGVFSIFYYQNKKLINQLKNKQTALRQKNTQYEEQALILKETQKKLEHTNSELEVYAYTTSHDLKQPVNTVNNFAKLLNRHLKKNECLDEKSAQYLDLVIQSNTNMGHLIDDLLAYARLSKKEDIPFEKSCLNDVLDKVLMNLKHQIDTNEVEIEKEHLPTLSVVPVKIGQVFQNIISNAIKFKKQDECLTIKISSVKKGQLWQLTIEDNGIGIDKKYQEKIFKPFRKVHNEEAYPGSGIGLSTCKRIVKLHQGDIWVESKINIGTKFHFTLRAEEVFSSPQSETELAPQRREG